MSEKAKIESPSVPEAGRRRPQPRTRSQRDNNRTQIEGYRLVRKPKEESPENEVRITSTGRISHYVSYIARLFDNGKDTIVIRATGRPISMAVAVSEVVKRRFKQLHQVSVIGMTDIVDTYEPLEGVEGEAKTLARSVPYICVTLSRDESKVDKSAPGYQAPLPDELVNELPLEEVLRSGRGARPRTRRGRARASRSPAKEEPKDAPRPRRRRPRRREAPAVVAGQEEA